MRARLSAISNFTTSQLLTILQNWTRDTSEIIVDGKVLTVTSFSFLSNDMTQSRSNTKKVILFSVIGSAGGLSFFLCFCCIIISVCIYKKFKSKRNYKLKPRFVFSYNLKKDDMITIHTEHVKLKEEKMTIKIIII